MKLHALLPMLMIGLISGLSRTALVAASDSGDDARYFSVPLNELKLMGNSLPAETIDPPRSAWYTRWWMQPFVSLDVPGEGLVVASSELASWGDRSDYYRNASITVRAEGRGDVLGRLYMPDADWRGMSAYRFMIPADRADPAFHHAFFAAAESHYRDLVERSVPGAAWFRHRMNETSRELTGEEAAADRGRRPGRRGQISDLEDTFAILSGGRAMSENLALDRVLQPPDESGEVVDVESIRGVTVREMQWDELIAGKAPPLDPLSRFIPEDQHALFFPSFQAVVTMMDESAEYGTPLLRFYEPRAEDAMTRERYEKQLCLSLNPLTRAIGPKLIKSVALTGSDPYLRTGADVAVLFETDQARSLEQMISGWQSMSATAEGAEIGRGEIGGLNYVAATTPDRRVCSYLSTMGDVVVVTNSLVQLERLGAVAAGSASPLSDSKEYIFFRDRYPRANRAETAMLMLTDPTIRRWLGPRWRIGSSRRIRAGAVLSSLQAKRLDALVRYAVEPGEIERKPSAANLGRVLATSHGVRSENYNTLEFLTPIVELDLSQVTQAEAAAYERWRWGYERQWRNFFDPIAVSFSVADARIETDISVMPLQLGTRYAWFSELAGNESLDAGDGDPHPEAVIHLVHAIDRESRWIDFAGRTISGPIGREHDPVDLMSWLGDSASLYIDKGDFWDEVIAAEDPQQAIEDNWWSTPIGLTFEVGRPAMVPPFLGAIRAYMTETTPDMLNWSTVTHDEHKYVRVDVSDDYLWGDEDLAFYYAIAPRALLLSINEDVIRRAMDRHWLDAARAEPDPPPSSSAWSGKTLNVEVDASGLRIAEAILGGNFRARMQVRAWAAIPILNEWKRRYPSHDPVELHERWWGVRLVSPGAGGYVWNPDLQSMESVTYGHPARPKPGPDILEMVGGLSGAEFGLTLEDDALRAVATIERGEVRANRRANE